MTNGERLGLSIIASAMGGVVFVGLWGAVFSLTGYFGPMFATPLAMLAVGVAAWLKMPSITRWVG